jgi:hypothetical protein
LPMVPGQPGLIFASRHEVASNPPWSLFVKRDPNIAVWTYLGDYEGTICGHLTPEQFKALSEKVSKIIDVVCVAFSSQCCRNNSHGSTPCKH